MSDTVTICIRVPIAIDATIRKLAKAEYRSINRQMVMMLKGALDGNGKRTVRAKKGRAR